METGSGRTSSFSMWRNTSMESFSNSSRNQDGDDEAALRWAALEKLPTYSRVRKGIRTEEEGQSRELIVGLDMPTIEVRFEHLSVEAQAYLEAEDYLLCSTSLLICSRMTLLLGPPSSGKTTLLLALAGKLSKDLKFSGRVNYNGHGMEEFIPQRTSAYISQCDLHIGEMTVKETLSFSARCQGVGTRYEILAELSRREKAANIKPDPDIDIFMKATALEGQETNIVTDYILKILGLEACAETMVGDEMIPGISGGQKKRVTTGEMLVGPARALFMDEISTGLDSSTTFQIVNSLRQSIHILNETAVISLLQPAPETYELFDDIILLSEGQIVYQGPRENVLGFFEHMGFKCPERKGVADFLQEVTSRKDQEQYWACTDEPYNYVSVEEFAEAFRSFHIGQKLRDELAIAFDKSKSHPAALTTKKYGVCKKEILKACVSREILLMRRNSLLTSSICSKFFKQYLMLLITQQMASSLFRLIAALGRNMIVANTIATLSLLATLVLGGFVLSRDDVKKWWIWGYWLSPMMYAQNGIAVNEFLGKSWNHFPANSTETLGVMVLKSRGIFHEAYWYWIAVGALIAYIFLFNFLFTLALKYLNPFEKPQAILSEEAFAEKNANNTREFTEIGSASNRNSSSRMPSVRVRNFSDANQDTKQGMVLPFQSLSITFDEIRYAVDMPQEMKAQGIIADRLELLKGISGAFRPGVLTALMGSSGAGKTTRMDVLAGRKTGGYIEGNITISGYPKRKETFAWISGYCEQTDIHSLMLQSMNHYFILHGFDYQLRLILIKKRYIYILFSFLSFFVGDISTDIVLNPNSKS
ncbi:hypothetical protein GH714_030348 [Hevea brasiliensis]|uniref:ABC transporter domain-containing protein n=1 Tax=Hevea brasiliensis TaxID=3981 RepID=A0A6A6N7A8_HEVBR|nr:hypothetical protein GH714_030348 [Hevea brasiliensis]